MPDGVRAYAVGDVHGRSDLLDTLLARIAADNEGSAAVEAEIVLLGDYVDRGPDSRGVLDRIAAGPPPGFAFTTLLGNHERSMLDVIEGGDASAHALEPWLEWGGRETLRSYGVASAIAYSDDLPAIRDAFVAAVPPAHVALLEAMPLSRRIGDYLFVHAGIRPGVAIAKQQPHDLIWIRDPFLACRDDHGCVVVHGHSISYKADDRPNRIGIDTGAYRTGVLTAVVLEGTTRRFLSTDGWAPS